MPITFSRMDSPDVVKKKHEAITRLRHKNKSGSLSAQREGIAAMQRKIAAAPGPKTLALEKAPEVVDRRQQVVKQSNLAEFGALRNRAEALAQRQASRASQAIGADTERARDALRRRFASQGGLNSGASIKQEQLLEDRSRQERTDVQRGIEEGLQDQQAQIGFQEAQEAQRRFESDRSRGDSLYESDVAQRNVAMQRNLSRETQNQQMEFQDRVFRFDADSKLRQLDLQLQQFALAKKESKFNRRLARYEAGNTGGLFGGGGFLGTGIGAGPADI